MNRSDLISSLETTFLNQDKYYFDKHVPEFSDNGKFLGDYFNQLAVEPLGDKPPRFYHTFSPFDTISNKAPHHAVVFEDGNILLNIDFDEYVAMRTAAMSTLVIKALGIDTLRGVRVLLFGSGRIATQAVKILASELGLEAIDIINKSGDLSEIKVAVTPVQVDAGSTVNIGDYDIIICHTQAAETVISADQLGSIKKGAILASFISSTEHGEFPDLVYDSTKANIITDWQQSVLGAKDMQRAQDQAYFKESDLLFIKDILSGQKVDGTKEYTVYRSTGTPIQNLAVLKLLV